MRRPSAGTSIAVVALFVALGGPAEAAKVISGSTIKNESITGKKIKARSVTLSDLSVGTRRTLVQTPLGSITGAEIRDAAVGTVDLAPSSITPVQLADNAVTSPKVENNTLTTDDIGANAIGQDELAASSVGAGEIRTNAIGASELANNSVDAAAIAANAVGDSELGPDAVSQGEIVTNGVGESEIAASSVGASEVIDGRLTAKDVGRFSGTFSTAVPEVPADGCTVATSPILTGTGTDEQDLRDDAILVTPEATTPIYVAARAATSNQLRVTVCNETGVAVPAATTKFFYVTFDAVQ